MQKNQGKVKVKCQLSSWEKQDGKQKSRKSEMPIELVWQFPRKTRQFRKIKEKWKWNANWACQRASEYEQPAIKFATAAQYLI